MRVEPFNSVDNTPVDLVDNNLVNTLTSVGQIESRPNRLRLLVVARETQRRFRLARVDLQDLISKDSQKSAR